MKVSFVSSQAISHALRYQMLRMQADLIKAEKEALSGRVADVGLALGARTGLSVSMSREIERLEGLADSNQLAASRLASTQLGLQQLTTEAQELLSTFATAVADIADPAIAKQQADGALAMLTSVLNSNLNGEHLFAGINTDVRPLNDFLDPASPNRTAFDTAFQTYFGFAVDDPAAAGITPADMDNFLATMVEPQFLGAGWNTSWSSATDQQIVSRITLTETAQTSVSANITAFRKLAMAAATVSALFQGELTSDVRGTILTRVAELTGEAITDLAIQQSQTGITQKRIESASERMSMQVDLFTTSISDLEGVDEYEAATRVSSLLAQIEISYSLTARMQQLNLVRYLS
jgi:flagellar hook-associated protein 3 FlgL